MISHLFSAIGLASNSELTFQRIHELGCAHWKLICVSLITIFAVYWSIKAFHSRLWFLHFKKKAKEHLLNVRQHWDHILSKTKNNKKESKHGEITKLPLEQLRNKLRTGVYSAEEVLAAYFNKAYQENQQVNAICEPVIEALEQSRQLRRENAEKQLLYGIPVSIKENISITGHATTMGCAKYLDQIRTEDAVIIQVLKSQGAIPFVRTNFPQTLLSFDCSNTLYGRTKNPIDPARSPGGSSGGEAALIRLGGSILGIGTDLGGSIRIPCHMCGIYGLKVTASRLSTKGIARSSPGQNAVRSCVGPMGRDVASLALTMKALCIPLMWELDPRVVPKPFDAQTYESTKPLRIGFYDYDGFVMATPGCKRAVAIAKRALQAAGHELVAYTPPRVEFAYASLSVPLTLADGGKMMISHLKHESVDPALRSFVLSTSTPIFIRRIMEILIRPWNWPLAKYFGAVSGIRNITAFWQAENAKDEYANETMKRWKELKLDAVICPGFACPAQLEGRGLRCVGACSYPIIYNLIDFPAGALPITTETEEDQKALELVKPRNWFETGIWKSTRGALGLPIGCQVVALPFQEELVLRVMRDIESKLSAVDE